MAEYVEFYKEWLPLPKNDFRILAMLAERGAVSKVVRRTFADASTSHPVNPKLMQSCKHPLKS